MAKRKIDSNDEFTIAVEKLLDMPVHAMREITETLPRYVEDSLSMNFDNLAYSQLVDIALTAKGDINDSLNLHINESFSQITKLASEALDLSSEKKFEMISRQIQTVEYSSLAKELSLPIDCLNNAFHVAYSGVVNVIKESEDQNQCFPEVEVVTAFEEQLSSPQKFSDDKSTWPEKKKGFYNIVIFIMVYIVLPIFIYPYLQEKVGMPVMTTVESKIKSIPQKDSEVIDKLDAGIEGTILENSKYYYKVSYIGGDGEEKEGYTAKRNLKLIESEEDPQKNWVVDL